MPNMQIKLLPLILLTSFAGAAAGIWGAYGAGPAAFALAATGFAFFCFSRTISRWRHWPRLSKVLTVLVNFAAMLLLGYVLFAIVTSPTITRERIAAQLRQTLAEDEGFSDINFSCSEFDFDYSDWSQSIVGVSGSVKSEHDWWKLNELILNHPWDGNVLIDWDIWIDDQSGATTGEQPNIRDLADDTSEGTILTTHRILQRWMFYIR